VSPIQIVVLCLRLVAIVFLLFTINRLYSLFAYFNNGGKTALNMSVVWFFAALQIATCAILWFFPASIATKLLPSLRSTQQNSPTPLLIEWQTLGVICIGLWSLSRSIPDTVYWLTFYSIASSDGMTFSSLGAGQKASMLTTVVELVIGLWLLLGAKGLAALLFKIRTAGLRK
jgi:hypothetical protein